MLIKELKETNIRKLEKLDNKVLKEYVTKRLKDSWSLEEIAGRFKKHLFKEVKNRKDKIISHESIYDWIYNGDKPWLYKYLKRKQSKRKLHYSRKQRRFKGILKERVSIYYGPKEVDKKEEFGHWEIDSVINLSFNKILKDKFNGLENAEHHKT